MDRVGKRFRNSCAVTVILYSYLLTQSGTSPIIASTTIGCTVTAIARPEPSSRNKNELVDLIDPPQYSIMIAAFLCGLRAIGRAP